MIGGNAVNASVENVDNDFPCSCSLVANTPRVMFSMTSGHQNNRTWELCNST